MDVSQRRWGVLNHFFLFRMHGTRMAPKGYSGTARVAINDTEEGRAGSRCGELVKNGEILH
jgi:hypothetical protein